MNKEILKRVFVVKVNNTEVELEDPNTNMTPDQVRKFYSSQYPQLTNGSVTGPVWKDDKMLFTFSTTVGTKG